MAQSLSACLEDRTTLAHFLKVRCFARTVGLSGLLRLAVRIDFVSSPESVLDPPIPLWDSVTRQ